MSGEGQDPDLRKWLPLAVLILPLFPTHAKANSISILPSKGKKEKLTYMCFFPTASLFILGYLQMPPEQPQFLGASCLGVIMGLPF